MWRKDDLSSPVVHQGFFFPNIDRKLRLLPIFCTFSALRSRGDFSVGIAGSEGLVKAGLRGAGLVTFEPGLELVRLCRLRSFGFAFTDLRLLILPIADSGLVSSSEFFPSISPSMVVPFVARYSSPTPTNLTTPRSCSTPSECNKKSWRRAALRLFVVGWIDVGRAVMVRM